MERDGTRWNAMERDGARWSAMERDGALALDCIPSQAEYVVLSPENAMVSEHQTSGEAVRAFAQYVLKTGKQGSIYKRAPKQWEIF